MHNSIPLISFAIFSGFFQHKYCGLIFCHTADNTMQRDDFAPKFCEIAVKFSYLVAKLRLDFFVNFKPCIVLRTPQRNRGNSMRHEEIIFPSVAILRIDFKVRSWARSCKKNSDLASTRFQIHSGLKNIHSRERIKKVPDSPANSPDT